jgi:hypothetical protein
MAAQRRSLWVLLIGGLLIGCNRSPEQPPGTGAKETTQVYFEAVIQQNWPKAYAALDPQSQQRFSSQLFSQLAQSYRSGLGFEPDTVHVRACEERGTDATAHVVLTGHAGTKSHRYKDAVTLRRADSGWRVVLPANFGQARKR